MSDETSKNAKINGNQYRIEIGITFLGSPRAIDYKILINDEFRIGRVIDKPHLYINFFKHFFRDVRDSIKERK